jgi:hypothetical protein
VYLDIHVPNCTLATLPMTRMKPSAYRKLHIKITKRRMAVACQFPHRYITLNTLHYILVNQLSELLCTFVHGYAYIRVQPFSHVPAMIHASPKIAPRPPMMLAKLYHFCSLSSVRAFRAFPQNKTGAQPLTMRNIGIIGSKAQSWR